MRNNPARREGYKAYCDGIAISENPYDDGAANWYWHEGWRVAEDDDLQIPSMIEASEDY